MSTSKHTTAGLLVVGLGLAGCGGSVVRPAALASLDRMMGGPVARDVQRDAPEAYAEVARAAQRAETAVPDGPDAVAARVADAEAMLSWASTQSRIAVARRREQQAEQRRAEAALEATRLEQSATAIDREIATRIAAEEQAARARTAAAATNAVPAAQRQARAADLRQQAELLLASATLLNASESLRADATTRLREATDAATRNDATAALVAAGRAFLAAEEVLRRVREGSTAAPGATSAAQLVTDLSATNGVEPRRDARGVVAVMRGLFTRTNTLITTAQGRIETMARVVLNHRDAQVRVEAFVGGNDRARAERSATSQAQAVMSALQRAGVPATRMQAAGLQRLGGEDRVEIVLVLPSDP